MGEKVDMKILMDNAIITGDLGGPSIVSAFCDITRYNTENVKLDMLLSNISDQEQKYLNFLDVGYMECDAYLSIKNIFKIGKSVFRYKRGKLCRENNPIEKFIYQLGKYDVVVDMGGICFTDDIPSKNLVQALLAKRLWILCRKLGVKVVLYTTAIGPFKTKKNIWSFKMYLNKYCNYAIMRDKKSEELYNQYRIKTPYCVAPDTAFCMNAIKPADEIIERSICEGEMIGVSLSFQLQSKTPGYFEVMKKVCQEIINQGFNLLLIANECSGNEGSDDRFVVKKMFDELHSKKIAMVSPVEMNGNELKWLISQCEIVISSRYHTLIASISSKVPCLALSWHHKYREALALVEQEKYIVENSEFDADSIIELFNDLYENRKVNRECIGIKLKEIQQKVLEANRRFLKNVENNNDSN